MPRTYLYGYFTPPQTQRRRTLAELEQLATWRRMDPEFRRRVLAMFDFAADIGIDLGLGGGWRSSDVQLRTAIDRHIVVASGGCCSYNGKRYALRPNMAHAAFPDGSYHEGSDVDGEAFAADLIGDLVWMNRNCWRFGLLHFADVNREPWHVQPVELPRSRRKYTGEQLAVWPTPNMTPPAPPAPAPLPPPAPPAPSPTPTPITEDDMPRPLIIIGNKDNPTDPRRWSWDFQTLRRLREGEPDEVAYIAGSQPGFEGRPVYDSRWTLAVPFWKPLAWIRSFDLPADS